MQYKKIKVLVVDDSVVFREILSKGITKDPSIEVVAVATDPFDARDKILKYEPDVMTCDVEMPKMGGLEFIKQLLPQYPLPVIVVSAVCNNVFDALNSGAVDFVSKPIMQLSNNIDAFIDELIAKIKIAVNAKVTINKSINERPNNLKVVTNKIIAIGASTGGTEAITSILQNIPRTIPGIVIVQHIPPLFSKMFADRLDKATDLFVKEAENGDYIEQGKVLIAPGDKQMRIKKVRDGVKVDIFEGEKVNGHAPSVDVLFDSVAKECGQNAIGVILTGMGYDGAKGLLAMRKSGANTIGQDEDSCVVYGMPRVAYNIGAVERQLPLDKIPHYIFSLLNNK